MNDIDKIALKKGFEPITSIQMYSIENNAADNYGMAKILMMENAGNRVSDILIDKFGKNLLDCNILAFCGVGNNGGDAIVAMRHISGYIMSQNPHGNRGKLSIVLMDDPAKLKTNEAKTNWNIIQKMNTIEKLSMTSHSLDDISSKISSSNIIIDGILGTGVRKGLRGPYLSVIELINERKANSFVLSVDVPSGMDPDTGDISEIAVKADATVTFHRIKNGLVKNFSCSGDLHVYKIGIPWESEIGII